MKTIWPYLAAAVLIAMLSAAAVSADPNTLYYQGYFNGTSTVVPGQGFVYRVDPNSIQTSFYYAFGPAGPPQGGYGQAAGWGAPQGMMTRQQLPGMYWYNNPNQYAAPPMCNLGYLYGRSQ
jgi:hypothetical protein